MMIIYGSACVFGLVSVVLVGIIIYCKWVYKYWLRFNMPYIEPTIPFGNLRKVIRSNTAFGVAMAELYTEAKSKGYKHVGLFRLLRPEYMPIHPDILKNVLVKDFNYFCDRGFYTNQEIDPLSGHLFLLSGDKWKRIRAKLTPTFTSGKIRTMFNLVNECSYQLKQALDVECVQGPVDVKVFLEKFGTDVIGSCAFGINCNSFTNPNNDFRKFLKREPSVYEDIRDLIAFAFPSISRFLKMRSIPANINDFFLNTVRNAVAYRKAKSMRRNDFLQILIDLMEDGFGLTLEEATAQAYVFFVAGYETSSTAMMFCLLELALNQEIQDKLRKEVMECCGQEPTYEKLNDLVYMRQVFDEVMRKHPPLPFLNRVCTMNYKVPNTDFVLTKDTPVTISVMGLHHDPEYFPEPDKFDPDRFAPGNKEKLVPFSYMPFGEGPRFCIGVRFGFTQMQVALYTLIRNYKFSLNDRTMLPLEIDSKSFFLFPKGSIWLNFEKI